MEEIIKILLNDKTMNRLVDKRIYPNYTTDQFSDCIVYTYNTTYNDKCVKHIRFKVNIIAHTLPLAEQIEKRLCELILTFGDEPLTHNILQVVANGGGDLYDTDRQMNHRIIYFDIITRC